MSVEVRDLIPKLPNSQVDIHVHVSAQLNITPFVARQKVSGVGLSQEARRAADRAVFGELGGCALSSGDPIWSPTSEPHWRTPYRLFDGTLLAVVKVDAHAQTVLLTEEERTALLKQVEINE
jgi:hypothetical protein